jgi:hypothetical protein
VRRAKTEANCAERPQFDLPQNESSAFGLKRRMNTVFELWDKAHEMYARARSTLRQSEKLKLMQQADGYLRQAEAQRQGAVVRAKYPGSSDARHTVTDAPLP